MSSASLSVIERKRRRTDSGGVHRGVIQQMIERLAGSRTKLVTYGNGGRSECFYGDLYPRVQSTAARLRRLLGSRVRVGVIAENSPELMIVDFACITAGLCTVYVDSQGELSQDCIQYLRGLGVDTVIRPNSGGGSAGAAGELRVLSYADVLTEAAAEEEAEEDLEPALWDGSDFLTIKQTSGSTDLPKAIGATVASIDDTLQSIQDLFAHDANDMVFVFLPLSLLQQRSWIYSSVYFGFEVVLTSFKGAFSALHASKPTVIMGVPKFYDVQRERIELKALRLMQSDSESVSFTQHPPKEVLVAAAKAVLGPNVRYMWTGSAPCSRETLEFFFGLDIPLFEGYGTNETDIISKNNFAGVKIGSVGKVLPTRRVTFTATGQIRVWKKHPVSSRYELGEDTAGGFEGDDTFLTGDIGYMDDDGYLHITGRASEAIVLSNGTTINPREIELKLVGSGLVRYAVVCGHNRPYLVAILDPVTRDGATDALERAVFEISARLGSSKRIGRVVFAAEDFSEANGCLSAQFKVRRQHVLEKYREEIAACYPM
jgi:long-chain acyl-CoA synthetase